MAVCNISFPALLAVLHMLSLQLKFRDYVVHRMLRSHTGVITKG